ncbi:MAG: AraC family transcriptional regulator [Arachnia propionica]|uniref:helix-turn-helix transcriptional regulator n=1 Tax=Arachnia propionica TaxID=1750 RepID=UPI0026F6028F|nr:AraC family transcriptional regulator [Arachnia propionica]
MSESDDSFPSGAVFDDVVPSSMTGNFLVAESTLIDARSHFARHYHTMDQLAWPQHGGLSVRVADAWWRVTQHHLVWIPAHTEHEVWNDGADVLLSLYVAPSLRPHGRRWSRPLSLQVNDLSGALIRHLCTDESSSIREQLSLALLRDVLEHSPENHDVLALPSHPSAHRVAEQLLADPASPRTIEDWAEQVGVSSRTLLRCFLSDTGTTFTKWRTRARTYHAARLLAEGWSVQDAAVAVGYATATGFIKAYRSTFGTTPAHHAARRRRQDL